MDPRGAKRGGFWIALPAILLVALAILTSILAAMR
jgi:hypothetical protein